MDESGRPGCYLAIVCVDNGHYGETGDQKSHTSLWVDLEKIAASSGIKATRTITAEEELAEGARLLRECNGAASRLSCCASSRPIRPPANATWIRAPTATAIAPRC